MAVGRLIGHRPAWAQRGRLCIEHHRLHHGQMVGTVCLGAESSGKGPHSHSVLGHSLLLVRAGLATERLCNTGPHKQQAGAWHSAFWRRTSFHVPPRVRSQQEVGEARQQYNLPLPPGLFQPRGQSVFSLSVSLLARCCGSWWGIGLKLPGSQADLVTICVGHCQLEWARGWAHSHWVSSPAPRAASWHSAPGRSLHTRVLTCIVPNLFAQLAFAFATEC